MDARDVDRMSDDDVDEEVRAIAHAMRRNGIRVSCRTTNALCHGSEFWGVVLRQQ